MGAKLSKKCLGRRLRAGWKRTLRNRGRGNDGVGKKLRKDLLEWGDGGRKLAVNRSPDMLEVIVLEGRALGATINVIQK